MWAGRGSGWPSVCERWLRDDDVASRAAVEGVVAASAFESVVADTAEQVVVAGVSDEGVVTVTVEVVATHCEQLNGACGHQTRVDDVIAAPGVDREELRTGDQHGGAVSGDGGAGGRRAADPERIRSIGTAEERAISRVLGLTRVEGGFAGGAEVHAHHADVRAGEVVAAEVHEVGAAEHGRLHEFKAAEADHVDFAGKRLLSCEGPPDRGSRSVAAEAQLFGFEVLTIRRGAVPVGSVED